MKLSLRKNVMNWIEQGSISLAAVVALMGCGAFTAIAQTHPRKTKA